MIKKHTKKSFKIHSFFSKIILKTQAAHSRKLKSHLLGRDTFLTKWQPNSLGNVKKTILTGIL